jgi:hypothetical protein
MIAVDTADSVFHRPPYGCEEAVMDGVFEVVHPVSGLEDRITATLGLRVRRYTVNATPLFLFDVPGAGPVRGTPLRVVSMVLA